MIILMFSMVSCPVSVPSHLKLEDVNRCLEFPNEQNKRTLEAERSVVHADVVIPELFLGLALVFMGYFFYKIGKRPN
jgi:hypothetical protein